MRVLLLLSMAAGVHGAANVAVLAQSMGLIAQALPTKIAKQPGMASEKSMPEAPGGLRPAERAEYFALIKEIGDMREQLKDITIDIEQSVYNANDKQAHKQIVTVPFVDNIFWNEEDWDYLEETYKNKSNMWRYIQLLRRAKEFIHKDRGARIMNVVFSSEKTGDTFTADNMLAAIIEDRAPILLSQNALENLLEQYHSVDPVALHKKLFNDWFLDGDNSGDFSTDFYHRCVRYNTQFGWFLMVPVSFLRSTDVVLQELGLTLDSDWVVVNSLEHAHKLAGNKKPSPLNCVPLMQKLLDTQYWWDLVLMAHGSQDFSQTCEMRPQEFKEMLKDLSDSAIPIARIVVVTCYGGSKEILQKVYGSQRFPFNLIFPHATEFELAISSGLSWRELFFFISNPAFPLVSRAIEKNNHTTMLIRHKNADHFELFDPWNKRAQEPGLRPDIKGTYAPAVPWRRGMKPEEIHPAARATA